MNKKYIKIFIAFLGFLLVVTVFLAIESAGNGSKLYYLEKERTRLEEENRQLKTELIAKTSLTKIEEIALSLGMKKSEDIIYIDSEVPIAKLP